INGWPVGTCWWSANANFAYFGFEGVSDGSSNTALFSEHLLGFASGNQGSRPFAGSGDSKRGIYLLPGSGTSGIPDYTVMSTGSQQLALQGVQACKSVPSTQQADGN